MDDFRKQLVHHIPHLRRYGRSLLRGEDESDDLVQECLMRAIRNQRSFKPGTNMRGWLFTIMHNLYIDLVRKRSTIRTLATALDVPGRGNALPNQIHSLELGRLDVALRQLPDDQRSTLMLVALEGLSYQEVADITGVAVGTVKSRVSRGREALRGILESTVVPVAVSKRIAWQVNRDRRAAVGQG